MKKATTHILMIIATLIIILTLFVSCNRTTQTVKTFTVSFVVNGGSNVSSVTTAKIDTEPVTYRNNFSFDGWYDNPDFNGNRISFPYNVTSDITLYAKWVNQSSPITNFKVNFVTNGGSEVSQMTVSSIQSEPITTREDYDFMGWYDNTDFNGNRISFPYTVTANITLYAKWQPVETQKWIQTTLSDYETLLNEDGTTNIIRYNGNDEHIILPPVDNITFEKSFLNQETPTIKSICIPSEITEVDSVWFAYVETLEEITINENHTTLSAYNGILFSKDGTTLIAYPLGKTDTTYTVPSTVKTVGTSAFNSNEIIEHIVVSEGVEKLDSLCFAGMTNLKTISLPNTLKETGSSCLTYNPLLEEVIFPASVTKCGYTTFNTSCNSLKRVTAPACMRLSNLPNLEYIKINSGTDIPAGAYSNCPSLKTVIIDCDIQSIGTQYGSGVFQNCTSLQSITLPNSVSIVGAASFSGCTKLDTINIPKEVKTIGSNAFKDCTALKSLILPEGLTSVGKSAFDNSGIEELYVPSSVTKFCTFDNVSYIKTLHCPAHILKNLYSSLTNYEKSPIQNLTVISGNIPATSGSTNSDLSSIHTLVIEKDVTSIDEHAFSGCHALKQITNLSGLEWSPLEIKGVSYKPHMAEYRTSKNTAFKGVITNESNGFVKYAYMDTIEVIVCDRSITSLSASDFSGYTSIGAFAFINCTKLTSVVIPSNIKSIGMNSFRWCDKLTNLVIENGVESIDTYAFSATNSLLNVTIPNSVTVIGMYAFTHSDLPALTINVKGYSSKPNGWHNEWYQKTSTAITINWNI